MPSVPMADQPTIPPQAENFYSGAYARIIRFMQVLGIVATIAVLARLGIAVAAGFLTGCAIAFVNFHWLKRVVTAFADRATASGERQSSQGVVLRFLLRYFLMALAAYAIFSVSPASLYGLFAGLFLPVAGIACEAAYEVYTAYARGL